MLRCGQEQLLTLDIATTPEHLVGGRHDVAAHEQIDELERTVEPTWSGLVEPLERLTDRLGVAWGTVSHLKAVRDSKELREAVEVGSAARHAQHNTCA